MQRSVRAADDFSRTRQPETGQADEDQITNQETAHTTVDTTGLENDRETSGM